MWAAAAAAAVAMATVCPTGLSDWSDRQSDVAWVGPTGRSDDRNV